MGIYNISGFLTLAFLLCISMPSTTSASVSNNFLQCFHSLTNLSVPNFNSSVIFTRNSSSYTSVLQSSIPNLRFVTPSTPKPILIIRPFHESHIQSTVICSRKFGINMRIRSGAHDYEGLSYVSYSSFIILDLSNFRSIQIDTKNMTAWVESGATLGELYYTIVEKSNIHGFPAGSYSTIGVGGHFCGGGFGTLSRKYGLAADNVIDAKIVDANGRILDKKSMMEDFFWAIRGGGSSFGIIFSWKINLVPVPPRVTTFSIGKTLDQGATKLLQKWQLIADKLPESLFLHVVLGAIDSVSAKSNKTIKVTFETLFLGQSEELLTVMEENFPELGVEQKDLTEMSWIQSVLYYGAFSINDSSHVLLNRTYVYKSYLKAKSDYMKEPISIKGLEGLWDILLENGNGYMIWSPYGGKMSEISESKIPFPHRRGNLYGIQYVVEWQVEEETEMHIDWIRRLYGYMTSFASKNPRSSYLNYRDLDLGTDNRNGNTSYRQASVWGLKYFKSNFKRLAQIKSKVDPTNFFRDQQSIPLFPPSGLDN